VKGRKDKLRKTRRKAKGGNGKEEGARRKKSAREFPHDAFGLDDSWHIRCE
jgi:hypothetical protein